MSPAAASLAPLVVLALAFAPSVALGHPTEHAQEPYSLPHLPVGASPAVEAHFVQQQLRPEFRVPLEMETMFGGLNSFGHLQATRCWGKDRDELFDVAVIGAPFDTGTSWRPDGQQIVDCGDVAMSFVDNTDALDTLTHAYETIIQRSVANPPAGKSLAKDGKHHPRIVTLGGDHTILLPILRGIAQVYGPVSVIHFDSHMDTWAPVGGGSRYADLNHGTMLWHASQEGLVANGTSVHAGLRSSLRSIKDYETDDMQGFHRVHAWEMSEAEGPAGIVRRIRDVVGDKPVYVSIDIDVLDPAFAPATGTPEIGGWSTREMKEVIAGMADMQIVGLDIVEVAPAYDTAAEVTSLAAAGIIYQFLSVFQKTPLVRR